MIGAHRRADRCGPGRPPGSLADLALRSQVSGSLLSQMLLQFHWKTTVPCSGLCFFALLPNQDIMRRVAIRCCDPIE